MKTQDRTLPALSHTPPHSKPSNQSPDDRLNSILATLGHEMRNPLSALRHAIEAWPLIAEDPTMTEQMLQLMQRQISQLSRLSEDLLDSARIYSGKLSIQSEPVDLNVVISHALEEVRPFIDRCEHHVHRQLCDRPITIQGDSSRLVQVFANLLQNASKFTPMQGNITIEVAVERSHAIVTILDDGRGMTPQEISHLTRPSIFYQGNSNGSNNGLGIGLHLAQSIVELHGGNISAHSDGIGLGTKFTVRLPLCRPELTTSEMTRSLDSDSGRFPTQHLPCFEILVVDDNRSVGFTLNKVLQTLGQSVQVTDCGLEAIQIARGTCPQIICLDLRMPGLSGFDVAREIRSHADTQSAVLVALSGDSDEDSRQQAVEAGFDFYLVKPVSIRELASVLSKIPSRITAQPR